MYNEERKNKFLSDTNKNVTFGKSLFNNTSMYEEEAGKDLCELPLEVLQPLVNTKFGARTYTTRTTISFLRSYIVWCKKNGYPTSDDVYQLKTVMDTKVRRVMIASPAHLEILLNKAFEPVSSETVDCLYRCFLWMAFAGLEEEETVRVTVDEIDFDSMTIEHAGKSYDIYREAVPAFRMACNATQFRYINPNYAEEKQGKYRDRFLGNHLFRGIRSPQIGIHAIRSFVGKKLKLAGVETSYAKIRLSGLFYKTYEMERIGEPINFDAYIVERINKTEHEFNANHTRKKLMGNIRRSLESDYNCWKEVFTK